MRHSSFQTSGRGWRWLLLAAVAAGCQSEDPAPEVPASGLVVETVAERSALAEAGLQPGDVLVDWERSPSPPANPQPSRGRFASAFDWHELVIEEAPRGPVRLTVLREGRERVLTVAPGEWRAEVRPLQAPAQALEPAAQALVLCELGEKQRREGDLEAAEASLRSALEIRRKVSGESLQVADSLLELGRLERDRQRPGAAERYLSEALALHQRLAPGSSATARNQVLLGMVAKARGELGASREFYRQALEIYRRIAPVSLGAAGCLTNTATLSVRLRDLEAAHADFEEARQIFETVSPGGSGLTTSLHGLGRVAMERGDVDSAEGYFQTALERYEPGGPSFARALNNLGDVAFRRGDLRLAQERYGRVRQILEAEEPASLDLAAVLQNLGTVAQEQGELEVAADYFRQALDIEQRLAPGSAAEADTLASLAVLARRQGRLDEAADDFLRSLEALEDQVGKLGSSPAITGVFRAGHGDGYRQAVEVLLDLGRGAEAFAVLERSRARVFLDLVAERDLDLDVPAGLERARRDLAGAYEDVQRRLREVEPQREPERHRQLTAERRALRRAYRENEDAIRRASPRFADLRAPRPLDLAAARAALEPGTVLLAYSVGKDRTDLFAVAPGRDLVTATLTPGRESLRREVRRLGSLVSSPPGSGLGDRAGLLAAASRRLYEVLLAPVSGTLDGAERLLILPDGPLHLLPWGALLRGDVGASPAGETFLVEWKPIHVALSATVYAELRRRRAGRSAGEVQVAAFGDPLYPPPDAAADPTATSGYLAAAAERGLRWMPLPASRREVEEIAALFPGSARSYLGASATEEAAKSLGGDVRRLHFAVHGHFDELFPLDSALAFALPGRPAAGKDDGLLRAWEILADVRLDADLVVLSACRSGLGRELSGEGLIGLTRAFQIAGARAVVASLWNVADSATAALMVRFYRNLRRGVPADEALRGAQVDLLRGPVEVPGEGERDLSAPYYWAAFQLFGAV